MSNVLKKFGAGAAALAAPFVVLTASPRALAEDCKQAPPPPSSRAYDLSKPVLIADAGPSVAQAQQPNCTQPSQPSAATFMRNRVQAVQQGLDDWDKKRRSLPSVPGG
jgi:hypothetical protein